MKKIILIIGGILLLAATAIFCFAFCGKSEPEPTHKMEPATYQRNISGKDAFEKGYYAEALGSHSKVTIRKLEPYSAVTWKIYFTKELLSEDEAQKLLERTPDITDNGEFNAGPYDYVYFFCDVNSKNSKEPTDDLVMIWYQATYV